MKVCLICLRADRLLKIATIVLEEFHNELCDFAAHDAVVPSTYYCAECEYLLTKFYKFKRKCVMAIKVYKSWKAMKDSRIMPVNHLYSLLPQTSLSMWTPNPGKIGNFTLSATDPHPQLKRTDEIDTKVTCKKEANVPTDHSYSACEIEIFVDEPKHENVSEKSASVQLATVKIENESEDSSHESLDELEHEKKKCKDLNVDPKLIKKVRKRSKRKGTRKEFFANRAKEINKEYESTFDIQYLTTHEEKLAEFQQRKTYECYVNAEYKCEICYAGFKSSKYLKYHTDNWHSDSSGKAVCSICKICTREARNHRGHHVAVYKCKLCPLVTHHRHSMQAHFEWHKGKTYRCEECDLTYQFKSPYLRHMGLAHRRGRHVCEGCGRGFISALGLSVHKSSSTRCAGARRGGAGRVRCEDCDVTLPSQEVYDAHVADVHETRASSNVPAIVSSGVDEYGLPKRIVSKTLPENLKRPRATPRRKPMEILCRVCGEVGPSYGWLQRHFKMEHPKEDFDLLYMDKKKHLCDICGAGFSAVYTLRDHMTIHSGERPYPCDLCPKRYRTPYLVRQHRQRHFPSAQACTLCGKQYKSKGNLYAHMQTHTDEKNHKCSICGKAFLYNSTLKEHIKGVHYNIRRVRKRGTNTELGEKRAKHPRRKVAEIEAENNETETIDASENNETETIDASENNETETIGASEVADTEPIETSDAETETLENIEYTEIETLDMYEFADTETMESS